MRRSMAERTARRTASTPRRWPSTRGSPRRAAQRPLPSIMIATWRGAGRSVETAAAEISGFDISRWTLTMHVRLDLHDFFFLNREKRVDFLDRLVGRFLNLFFLAPLVILTHRAVFLQLF